MRRIAIVSFVLLLAMVAESGIVRANMGGLATSYIQNRGGGLPDGCVAIEYLESAGGIQWIDTGIVVDDNNYVLKCDMERTQVPSLAWCGYFGSYPLSTQSPCTRLINSGTSVNLYVNYSRVGSGGNTAPGYTIFDPSVRTVYMLYNGKLDYYRNEKLFYSLSISAPNGIDTDTIRVFGDGAYMRLYRFSIMYNGEPIIDLIPVRDDVVGCLYDTISGQLFYNEGTDEFIVGPDL